MVGPLVEKKAGLMAANSAARMVVTMGAMSVVYWVVYWVAAMAASTVARMAALTAALWAAWSAGTMVDN